MGADYAYTHVLIHTSAQILANIKLRTGCKGKHSHCLFSLAKVVKQCQQEPWSVQGGTSSLSVFGGVGSGGSQGHFLESSFPQGYLDLETP